MLKSGDLFQPVSALFLSYVVIGDRAAFC